MAPSLVTIDASEPLDKIYEIIERDGGVIVANFLSPELLKECMDSIEPFFKERKTYTSNATHEELGPDFFPEGSQRVYALLSKIPDQIVKLMRLPVWQGIMGQFLNDEFASYTGERLVPQKSGYMLASTAALRLVPGAKPQPLHRDQIAYQTRPDPSNPLFTPMVGCLIAGSECTYENGATAVIPGSHLWGADRMPKIEECTYAEMEPGSALFTLGCEFLSTPVYEFHFHSCIMFSCFVFPGDSFYNDAATYHGAGENKCDKSDPLALRTLFACFAQRDYFRQDQDEVLSTPIEIARRLPEDILKLAGYYKAVGGVGYVEDHQSPHEFLHRDDLGTGMFGAANLAV
ncbi:phytanoyl-CoA dioxygenase family protein [Aspergillus undulatus]|uniref:phytanoyl-CoA dioxygenase family protein n=1 Tax=Aspergillus undulatus TaxID=1810928 RepID=UPI003CCCD2FC